ncbi:MAG: hypothetical protein HC830_00460 [Bacteroidetes bacterium]|nr:hypothetical protein [Bacteroidota bacterium]
MKKRILSIAIAFGLIMSACTEYFEYDNNSLIKEELVYSDYNYMKQVLASAYTLLPSTFNRIDNGMLASASDESEHA